MGGPVAHMSDADRGHETHADHHGEHDAHADHGHGRDVEEGTIVRETAPMQSFRTRQVWIGLAVLLVGLVVTFGLPLALV